MFKQLSIAGVVMTSLLSFAHAQAISSSFPWIAQFVPAANNFSQLTGTNPLGTGSVTCSSRARTGGNPLARAATRGSLTSGTAVNSTTSESAVRAQSFARLGGTGTGGVMVNITINNGPVTSTVVGSGFSGEARSSVNFQSTLATVTNLNAAAAAFAVLPPIQPTIQTLNASGSANALGQSQFFYETTVEANSNGTITGAGAGINLLSRTRMVNSSITLL
ncbi:MAG: hypothetical protein AB8H80_09255 [Planctomycetota bacterium]